MTPTSSDVYGYMLQVTAVGFVKMKGMNCMEKKMYSGINMERTGKWLRYICRFKGITVKSLCESMGMGSGQSVYAWFCGRTLPSLDNFYILSQIISVPLDALIIGQGEYLPGRFCKRVGNENVRLMMYSLRFAD
ncbi:MAG TPA: hypothetical protein DIW07_04805 [Lachnospiraceae bacterium]|nr:hypothetical protein [Lachnospiraceae bacterium]HCR82725.1 hypothetical protein [Lachnospiraceae bacterium]